MIMRNRSFFGETFRTGMFRRDHNFSQEDIDFIRALPISKEDAERVGVTKYDEEYFCDFLAFQLARFRKNNFGKDVSEFMEFLDIDKLHSAMRGFLVVLPRASQFGLSPVITQYIIPFTESEKNDKRNFYRFAEYDPLILNSSSGDQDVDLSMKYRKNYQARKGVVTIHGEGGPTKKTTIDLKDASIDYIYGDPFVGGWWAASPMSMEGAILLGKNRFCISYFDKSCNMWNSYSSGGDVTIFISRREKSIVEVEEDCIYLVFTLTAEGNIREIKNGKNLDPDLSLIREIVEDAPVELFDSIAASYYPIEFFLRAGAKSEFYSVRDLFVASNWEGKFNVYESVVKEILSRGKKSIFEVVPKNFLPSFYGYYGEKMFEYFDSDTFKAEASKVKKALEYRSIHEKWKDHDKKDVQEFLSTLASTLKSKDLSPIDFGGAILGDLVLYFSNSWRELYSDTGKRDLFFKAFKDFCLSFSDKVLSAFVKRCTEVFCSNIRLSKYMEILYYGGFLDFSVKRMGSISPEYIKNIFSHMVESGLKFSNNFLENVLAEYVNNIFNILPVMPRIFHTIIFAILANIPFDKKKILTNPKFISYIKRGMDANYLDYLNRAFLRLGVPDEIIDEYVREGIFKPRDKDYLEVFLSLLEKIPMKVIKPLELEEKLSNITVPDDQQSNYFSAAIYHLISEDVDDEYKKVLADWLIANDVDKYLQTRKSGYRRNVEFLLMNYQNIGKGDEAVNQ